MVYLIILQIYLITLITSILRQEHAASITLNAIFFSILTALAFASHWKTMTTNPGILPLNYKDLDEGKITLKFTKLFDEREQQHFGPVVRKLLRNG